MTYSTPLIGRFKTFKGDPPIFLGRILGRLGTPITRGDITSIAYTAIDVTTLEVLDTGTIDPLDVLFDQLITPEDDPRAPDEEGYNFLWEPDEAVLAPYNEGISKIEIKFTPEEGNPFHLIFRGETIGLLSDPDDEESSS